jgi:hypothetical protein
MARPAFLIEQGARFVVSVGMEIYPRGLLSILVRFSSIVFIFWHAPVICKKRPRGPEATAPAGDLDTSLETTGALRSAKGCCCSSGNAEETALAQRVSSTAVATILKQTARPQRCIAQTDEDFWGWTQPYRSARHVTARRRLPARDRQSASVPVLSHLGRDLRSKIVSEELSTNVEDGQLSVLIFGKMKEMVKEEGYRYGPS